MSNIYIQEPPTSGKVLLKTTAGDIDIELWSKECPKACRNFIQLCLEGYYNGTIFHRVVKGFIVQGGDPKGDGSGGESVYGIPFKDEFHSRLRFVRRGLVGMANADKDDNGSQFFFTMGPTPELSNKHTLFGKVTGNTVFNMLKLEEGVVDHNERPVFPHKIIKTEVLSNPFTDIEIREKREKNKVVLKVKDKGIKNFGLLSFGEEADQDERETTSFVKKNSGKGKSTHDILNDPTLSKQTIQAIKDNQDSSSDRSSIEEYNQDDKIDNTGRVEQVKNRLKAFTKLKKERHHISEEKRSNSPKDSDSDEDVFMPVEEEKKKIMRKKKEQIMQEIQLLKKNYKEEKKNKEALAQKQQEIHSKTERLNEIFEEYNSEKEKYVNLKNKLLKKDVSREEFTLQLLSGFKTKLNNAKKTSVISTPLSKNFDEDLIEEEIKGEKWLCHNLKFESNIPVLAKDASKKSDDWYDVYDPRNPINKRKRGEETVDVKKINITKSK